MGDGIDEIYGDYVVDGLETIDFSYFNNRLQETVSMKFYCFNIVSS
jgi:hypothetical protein